MELQEGEGTHTDIGNEEAVCSCLPAPPAPIYTAMPLQTDFSFQMVYRDLFLQFLPR
jgi:hypothetical protein